VGAEANSVPHRIERIQQAILSFSAQGCGLILTTGGTGVADRDVTPEAIRPASMRMEIPGFGEVMRMKSFDLTPNAILSAALPRWRRSLVICTARQAAAGLGRVPRLCARSS